MPRSRSTGLQHGTPSRVSRKAVLEAARRHFDFGDTQAAISADMGISPSYLARLLRQAKENGWIRFVIDADRETELAAELLHKFPGLVHAEVVADPPDESMRARLMPRDLGIAMAGWFNNLLDNDEETGSPQIWNVAIGGSAAMAQMVDRVSTRQRRVSVGPTSLTPMHGRITRVTAPLLAMQLGVKLGALSPGNQTAVGTEARGHLYFGGYELPTDNPSLIARWFHELPTRPGYPEILGLWNDLDAVFVSAVPLALRYSDLPARLGLIGTSVEDLAARGGSVLFANRVLNANGEEVPLAEGVPSYEPCVATEALRACAGRHASSNGRCGFVVLESWSGPSNSEAAASVVVNAGLANVLFCDSHCARSLLAS